MLSATDGAHYNYDDRYQGDDLVEDAQNYAWRYGKHKEIELLDWLLENGSGGGTWRRLIHGKREEIDQELAAYQSQYKSMTLY